MIAPTRNFLADNLLADNLLENLPSDRSREHVDKIAGTEGGAGGAAGAVRIERIVSFGQASPPGFWYEQRQAEWVVVLEGAAGLLIEGEAAPRRLGAGDHVDIPAGCRHRVEWTDPAGPTIWLAVHYG